MFSVNSLFRLKLYRDLYKSFHHITLQKSTLKFLVPGVALIIIPLGEIGFNPSVLGVFLIIYGYVHHITLRNTRHFIIFTLVSLIMLPFAAVMHNVFYGLDQLYGQVPIFHRIFESISIVSFVLAILAPAGVICGLIGIVVTMYRRKRAKRL
jgi:hypothetical protein